MDKEDIYYTILMNKDSIKQIIFRGQQILEKRTYVPRDLHIPLKEILTLEKIIAIIGPRRVGKTYYLRQLVDEMGLTLEHIVFIDFSEIQSQDISSLDIPEILTCYYELYPDKTPCFLLDEIQELDAFEPALKFLLNQQLSVVITGSNSRNLIADISSSLRGKVLPWFLMPLSFKEYLSFNSIQIDKADLYTAQGRGLFYKELNHYLYWGGFPEVVLSESEDLKKHLISSYMDTMLFRDVIERHHITNIPAIKELLKRMLRSYTKEFSISKCYNTLKSMGIKVGKDTLHNYVSYLEESMFFCLVENHKNPRLLPKKVYLIDNGLHTYVGNTTPDTGRLFENRVFLDLYSATTDIQFIKDQKNEIDFLLSESKELIQVTLGLHGNNVQRELNSLLVPRSFTPSGRTIITYDARIDTEVSLPVEIEHRSYIDLFLR